MKLFCSSIMRNEWETVFNETSIQIFEQLRNNDYLWTA